LLVVYQSNLFITLLSVLDNISEIEKKFLLKILDHRAAKNLDGFSEEFERDILEKTGATSITDLLSKLHRELIHVESPYSDEKASIDYWLNDHRLRKFQLLTDQAVRILDLHTRRYIYLNQANEAITGLPNDVFSKKGLMYTYSRIHPWDLLHLISITKKVLDIFPGMKKEDQLNSKLTYDIRYNHPSKGYIRINQNILPVSIAENGKPAIVIIQSSDISEIKKSTRMQYYMATWKGKNLETIFKGSTSAYGNILSDREIEILTLLSEGFTSNQIAKKVSLSPETIRTHSKNIINKVGAKNMTEVVKIAVIEGWI